jgi:hypothetical protein
MSTDSIAAAPTALANARELADDWVAARVRLMAELEASLHCSREALLALDLVAIERQTDEQAILVRKFEELLREGMLRQASQPQDEKDTPSAARQSSPGWEEELRRKATRIVEATRLQAALLTRAQCKLRILANVLAGPSVIYGPFRGWNQALTTDSCSAAGERADPCRV